MSSKKMLLPAALIAVIAMLAPRANGQTMGEYATTTAGAASGAGGMGPSFSLPVPSISNDNGGSSGTWGASRLGASFEERAAAVSGSGKGESFEARAAAMSGRCFCSESRWPGTGFSGNSGSKDRFGASEDRFKTGDRFTANDRFTSSGSRWPTSSFQDHMGLDNHYNSVNGN